MNTTKPSKKCKVCYGTGEYRRLAFARYEILPDCERCRPEDGRSCGKHKRQEHWERRICGCVEVRP